MKWYFPAWNGDVRIEVHPDDSRKTLITMIAPTIEELRIIGGLTEVFKKMGWLGNRKTIWNPRGNKDRQVTIIHAPLFLIGLFLAEKLKPGLATLHAIKLEDGTVTAMGAREKGIYNWFTSLFGGRKDFELGDIEDLANALFVHPDKALPPSKEKVKEKEIPPHRVEAPKPEPKPKPKPAAAVSVKRSTPSCPRCELGAIEPATEVLLEFLDAEQHELWANERAVIARGNLTGHRYLISHRNGPHAAKAGKICFDLDDGEVLHFHDWSVPPEEEVLAAKLIMEHRENWLRNEATCLLSCLYGGEFDFVFKNPFGHGDDGVEDSNSTGEFGNFMIGFLHTFDGGKYAIPGYEKYVAEIIRKQGLCIVNNQSVMQELLQVAKGQPPL